MKKIILAIIVTVCLIGILSIISADEIKGKIKLKTPSWELVKQEKGTTPYIDNIKSKTPLICEIYPNAKNKDEVVSKNIYASKDKKEKKTITKQQVEGKWANCYKVTNEKYVQIGDNSTIFIYQDYSMVEYIDGDVVTSFILEKYNGTSYKIEPEDIWIKNESECRPLNKTGLCFGALDNNMNETQLANYRYVINSSSTLILIEKSKELNETTTYTYPIFYTYQKMSDWKEIRQEYNFDDICKKSFANCQWTINDNTAIVDFVSNKYIDPDIINVSACGTLNTPNTYYQLNSSIIDNTISSDCIIISAQNVTLDCNGFSISSIKNVSAIYTNQFNTTVKNCNISIGSSAGNGLSSVIGIEYITNANSGTIVNNTIYSYLGYGIFINGADKVNVSRNRARSNSYVGIRAIASDNSSFDLNFAQSNISYGFGVESSDYNNIINNIGMSSTNYGIDLENMKHTNILSNNGSSNVGGSSYGFYVLDPINITFNSNYGTSNGTRGIYVVRAKNSTFYLNRGIGDYGLYWNQGSLNNITNNTGIGNTFEGITIITSSDNTLTSNTGTSSSGYGIYASTFSNITFKSNIGISDSDYGFHYRLMVSSNSNLDNGISNSSYGMYIYQSSNNTFSESTAIGNLINSYGLVFRDSHNNFIRDSKNISGINGDVYYFGTVNNNNTFLNCSYDTEPMSVGNTLIRQWYYRVYTNDTSGNPVSAVINATNSSNNLQFSVNTNSSGYSPIQILTDYININGVKYFYSMYNITAFNPSFPVSLLSHPLNVSLGNNLDDYFTFYGNDTTPPNATLISPADLLTTNNTTQNFTVNITDNYSGINNATIYIYDSLTNILNYTTTIPYLSGIFQTLLGISVTLTDGVYNWFYSVFDYSNNQYVTENRTLTINTSVPPIVILPYIDIISPMNQTYNYPLILINLSSNGTNVWWQNNYGINNTYTIPINNTFNQGLNIFTAYANNSLGNMNSSTVSLFVDSIYPTIEYVPFTETDGSVLTTRNYIQVNVTSNDTNLFSITTYLYNETSLISSIINTTSSNSFVTFSGLNNGIYFFNASSCDTLNNCNNTLLRNVTINQSTIIPNVTLISPPDYSLLTNNIVNFSFIPSDIINLSRCDIYGNWTGNWMINYSFLNPINNNLNSIFLNISDGTYIWNVVCNNTLGVNSIPTLNYTFIIDTSLPVTDIDFIFTPTLNTYQVSTLKRLKTFCYDTNYSYCGSDVNCLLNIYYPNSSLMIINSLMTRTTDSYIYDLSVSQTSLTGNYNGLVRCSDNDQIKSSMFTYSISNTGNNINDDVNNLPSNIWIYSSRNLTYYPESNQSIGNITININNTEIAEAVWNYNGTISDNILTQIATKIECIFGQIFNNEEGWGIDITEC